MHSPATATYERGPPLPDNIYDDAIVDTKPEAGDIAPECIGDLLFEPGDGDIQISVNGMSLEAHKYVIKRFEGLRPLLNKAPLEISIQRDDISAKDFSETLKVVYASVISGPFVFTSDTLVPALRVATIYKHRALRDYCIQYLETLELDNGKKPAYQELGMRDAPITKEEARVIGLDAFVIIAELREKEQRRQGKEIGAASGTQSEQSPVLAPTREVSHQDTIGGEPQGTVIHPPPPCTQLLLSGDKPKIDDMAARVDNDCEYISGGNVASSSRSQTRLTRALVLRLPSDTPTNPFIVESSSQLLHHPRSKPVVPSNTEDEEDYLKPFIVSFRLDPFTTHDRIHGCPVPASTRPGETNPTMLEFQLYSGGPPSPTPESEYDSEGDPTSKSPPELDAPIRPGPLRYFDGDTAPSPTYATTPIWSLNALERAMKI